MSELWTWLFPLWMKSWNYWQGRSCALQDNPPLTGDFCRFCQELKPQQKVLLTHLREFGRAPDDYWDEEQAEKICSKIQDFAEGVSASPARMGESVLL